MVSVGNCWFFTRRVMSWGTRISIGSWHFGKNTRKCFMPQHMKYFLNYRIPRVDNLALHTWKERHQRVLVCNLLSLAYCWEPFLSFYLTMWQWKTKSNTNISDCTGKRRKTLWFIFLSRAEQHSFRHIPFKSSTQATPTEPFSHQNSFLNWNTTRLQSNQWKEKTTGNQWSA